MSINKQITANTDILQENFLAGYKNLIKKGSCGDIPLSQQVHQFEQQIAPYVNSLRPKQKRVVGSIFKLNADHPELHFSQIKLAEACKVGLSTVKRVLRKLKEMGIISWLWRGVKKTCLYTVNFFMGLKSIRDKFVGRIPELKYIPLGLLIVSNLNIFARARLQMFFSENEPQYIESVFTKSLSLSLFFYTRTRRDTFSLSTSNTERAHAYMGVHALYDSARNEIKKREEIIQARKKREMKHAETISAISNIRSMKLTPYGKAQVGIYPAKAIKYADDEMMKSKNISTINNPMALFKSMCNKYMQHHKIKPDWSILDSFKFDNHNWLSMKELADNRVDYVKTGSSTPPSSAQSHPLSRGYKIEEQWRLQLNPRDEITNAIADLESKGIPLNPFLKILKDGLQKTQPTHDKATDPIQNYYPSFMKPSGQEESESIHPVIKPNKPPKLTTVPTEPTVPTRQWVLDDLEWNPYGDIERETTPTPNPFDEQLDFIFDGAERKATAYQL